MWMKVYNCVFHSKDIIKMALGREVGGSRHKFELTKSYVLARLTELRCEERRRV